MRKILCLLIALVLCVSIAVPAFAAEDSFVPSIIYKPTPEVVPTVNEQGEEVFGIIRNEAGEVIDYVDYDCLIITPVAHVLEEGNEVPAEVEQLLTFVYEELNTNDMEIPYEKHGADLDPSNMVIRDLFDARWECEEHHEMIEEDGVVFEITFDLGVVADAQIYVMTYDEDTKEWSPIVKTVNNGDGTVTCTFEHLCAIEFSMPLASTVAPSEDVHSPNVLPWIIALILAAFGIVIIAVPKKKKEEV